MSKYDTVYQSLLERLDSDEFSAGDRLPTETVLSESYKVSRTVVRRALERLGEQGLVVKEPNRGFYAAGRPSQIVVENVPVVCVRTKTTILEAGMGSWFKPLREGLMMGSLLHGMRLYEEIPSPHVSGVTFHKKLAGMIVVQAGTDESQEDLADIPPTLPCLLVNRPARGQAQCPSISVDHHAGSFHATDFLLRLGHRKIVIDAVNDLSFPGRQRTKGYYDAFESAGLRVDPEMVIQGPWQNPDWPASLRAVLAKKPTALLVENTARILHLLDILKQGRLSIPDDISLIVFDDMPVLPQSDVPITVLAQPLQRMGVEAMAMMKQMIDKQEIGQRHRVLSPDLIMRGSVGLAKKEK